MTTHHHHKHHQNQIQLSSNRPPSLEIAKLILKKCSEVALENKPDYISKEEAEAYMSQFVSTPVQDWMTLYQTSKAKSGPKLDQMIVIWDGLDMSWPFLKHLKNNAVNELDRLMKLLCRLFDTIVLPQ